MYSWTSFIKQSPFGKWQINIEVNSSTYHNLKQKHHSFLKHHLYSLLTTFAPETATRWNKKSRQLNKQILLIKSPPQSMGPPSTPGVSRWLGVFPTIHHVSVSRVSFCLLERGREKETLTKSCQAPSVTSAQFPELVNLVLYCQTDFPRTSIHLLMRPWS